MGFANPAALWGLLALSVPILVHLFDFRRSITVSYSDVRLLKNLVQQQSSTRNLKRWLLLLTRCLLVLLITLAFSKPYLGASPQLGKREAVGIFIDNSPSMSAEGKEGPLLEMAKEAAREVIRGRPADTRYLLTCFGNSAPTFRLRSKEEALEAIDQVTYSHASKTIAQAIQKLKDGLVDVPVNGRKIFIFSDFQKSQWGTFSKDSSYRILAGVLQAEEQNNVFIDSAWFSTPVLGINRPVSLIYRIVNEGETDQKEKNIRLKSGNQLLASGKFSVQPRQTTIDTLSFRPSKSGWCDFTLEIDDQPMEFDNRFYLAAQVNRKVPVLIIAENAVAQKMRIILHESDGFNTQIASPGNIPYDRINNFDVIMIQGISVWNLGLKDALQNFLLQRKSLVYFSGKNTQNEEILLPWGIQLGKNQGATTTEKVELEDPIFQGVFSKIPQNTRWPTLNSWKPVGGSGIPIFKSANGEAWLSRFSVQGSQVFVSGTDLTNESSDFTQNALFVPFIYQTALLGNAASPPSFRLGQGSKFVTSIPYSSKNPLELTSTRDTIIPNQSSFNGNAQLDFSQVPNEPGFYRYKQELGLAFNVPTMESQLSFPNQSDINNLKNQYHFNLFEIVEAKKGSLLGHSPPIKSTASRWMLGAAFLLLGLEWFLARK
jgi:Aerotolerance regulator N-terminal/von Willebrand factor type A domain